MHSSHHASENVLLKWFQAPLWPIFIPFPRATLVRNIRLPLGALILSTEPITTRPKQVSYQMHEGMHITTLHSKARIHPPINKTLIDAHLKCRVGVWKWQSSASNLKVICNWKTVEHLLKCTSSTWYMTSASSAWMLLPMMASAWYLATSENRFFETVFS